MDDDDDDVGWMSGLQKPVEITLVPF